MKTQETHGDAEHRLQWKLRLARLLSHRRWMREQVEELFQFIDWIMTLPEALEDRFEISYTEMESEQTMAETMPPLLRRAQERGVKMGEKLGVVSEARALLLRLGGKRLGEASETTRASLDAIQDKERLEQLCERIFDVESWEELLAGE